VAPKASPTAVQGGGSGTDTGRRPPYPLPHSGSVNNASSFYSSSQIDMRGTEPDGDDSLEEGELSEASYSNPQSPMEGKGNPPTRGTFSESRHCISITGAHSSSILIELRATVDGPPNFNWYTPLISGPPAPSRFPLGPLQHCRKYAY
jgi:hypothetical protein